ncbi:MAG: hypothetical protein ACJA1L_003446 [Paracoccaceae bacterium]|jgi:hypothetical protein
MEDQRSVREGLWDLARGIMRTDADIASRHARQKVEMPVARLTRIMGLSRLRLRAPNGARDEVDLAAAVQNLRELAKLILAPA